MKKTTKKTQKKKVHVQYFALLREQAEKQSETILTEAENAQDLYQELSNRYGFSLKTTEIRVAINEEFQGLSMTLSTEDSVVFIPPVAGG